MTWRASFSPERGRGVHIGRGSRGGGGLIGGLVEGRSRHALTSEDLLGGRSADWRRTRSAEDYPGARAAASRVQRDQHRRTHEGEVAGASRDLHEGATRTRRKSGDTNLLQQLVGPQGCGEGACEELVRGNGPPSLPAGGHHLGAEGDHGGRELRGGIGMSEVAPDRAAMADRQVADQTARLGQHGEAPDAPPHLVRGRADG